jgi:hypothetical protein
MGDFKNQKSGEHTQATSIKRVSTLSDNKKYKLKSFLDSDNDLSFEDILKKGFKHSRILMVTSIVCFSIFYIFRPEGTKGVYQQTSTAVFSSADNNTLFRSLDSLVPAGDEGRVSDDLSAYTEKAMTLLKSNEFIDFCFDSASKDPVVLAAFKSKDEKKLKPDELKLKISDYLRNKIEIMTLEKKTLVSYKNTKGGFNVKFQSSDSGDLRDRVSTVSKLMGEFLTKKDMEDIQSARTLVQDRLALAQKDFDENSAKRIALANAMPTLDVLGISPVLNQYSSTKIALSGNKALAKYFEAKIGEIQKKVEQIKQFKEVELKEKDAVSGRALKNEVASLYYLKNSYAMQGMDQQSFPVKRVGEGLDKASQELESYKAKLDQKEDESNDDNSGNASARFSQNLETLQSENVFYETKLKELDDVLKRMNEDLGKKIAIESQIKALDTMLTVVQRKIESLKNGIARLDVSDFKALRRVSFVYSPVVFSQGYSVFSFLIFSGLFSFAIGFAFSLTAELKNPSLTQIKSFEELGLKVLGGLPSYKNPLLNDLDEKYHFYFSKCAINLENTLNFLKSKIVLISSVDDCMQSATVGLNLGLYFSNTGRKILIIETDLINNSLVSLTGAPLDGGISELSFHEGEVNISPFQFQKGLDILTGNPDRMPKEFRLASQEFFNLLGELKEQYDFIFIHARSCLEGSEAADLSRYAGLSLVTCDAKTIKIDLLERFVGEMKGFLSKESLFVLDDPDDLLKVGQGDPSRPKVSPAALRKNAGAPKTDVENTEVDKASKAA